MEANVLGVTAIWMWVAAISVMGTEFITASPLLRVPGAATAGHPWGIVTLGFYFSYNEERREIFLVSVSL